MKQYFLTYTDPKTLLKKLGILGLVIFIPVVVLRMLLALLFGSWMEAFKSFLALTMLLFIFDFTYFFASRKSENKKEDKPNPTPEPEVKEEPTSEEEDPLKEILKKKLNK